MEMSVQPNELLLGCGVAFVGSLGGVTRQEAKRIVKRAGGVSCKLSDSKLNLVVLGADEMPDGDPLDQLTADQRLAVEEGRIEVIDETQFWEKLGLVDAEQNVHRLYTPAMLAQLLEISVAKVRNWYRRGLLIPVREVHQLSYFNFQRFIARHLLQLTLRRYPRENCSTPSRAGTHLTPSTASAFSWSINRSSSAKVRTGRQRQMADFCR